MNLTTLHQQNVTIVIQFASDTIQTSSENSHFQSFFSILRNSRAHSQLPFDSHNSSKRKKVEEYIRLAFGNLRRHARFFFLVYERALPLPVFMY